MELQREISEREDFVGNRSWEQEFEEREREYQVVEKKKKVGNTVQKYRKRLKFNARQTQQEGFQTCLNHRAKISNELADRERCFFFFYKAIALAAITTKIEINHKRYQQ